jgi:hypothetical protein
MNQGLGSWSSCSSFFGLESTSPRTTATTTEVTPTAKGINPRRFITLKEMISQKAGGNERDP